MVQISRAGISYPQCVVCLSFHDDVKPHSLIFLPKSFGLHVFILLAGTVHENFILLLSGLACFLLENLLVCLCSRLENVEAGGVHGSLFIFSC